MFMFLLFCSLTSALSFNCISCYDNLKNPPQTKLTSVLFKWDLINNVFDLESHSPSSSYSDFAFVRRLSSLAVSRSLIRRSSLIRGLSVLYIYLFLLALSPVALQYSSASFPFLFLAPSLVARQYNWASFL